MCLGVFWKGELFLDISKIVLGLYILINEVELLNHVKKFGIGFIGCLTECKV